MKFAFFGTDEFATIVLDELKLEGYIPSLIVCSPDKPLRRNKGFVSPETKTWAKKYDIAVFQPAALDAEAIDTLKGHVGYDFFVVASYGLIIPQAVLDVPERGTLNVHPSLLPHYRGASPVETVILENTLDTGVTIMEMDSKMDHGPIIAQTPYSFTQWTNRIETRDILAHVGGKTLAHSISGWLHKTTTPIEQNHAEATFTKLLTKADAELDLNSEDQEGLYRRFLAFEGWIQPYFFIKKDDQEVRVIVKKAKFDTETQKFIPLRIIPEGKKEVDWEVFEKGL